ncbi:transposase [Escherichia coli]|nr:transposase [Escherichia coli]OKW27459.1 transposase [Escherichia coli]
MTDFGGKTSIFSHPVYLFLREFSLQDSRGGSVTTTLRWKASGER